MMFPMRFTLLPVAACLALWGCGSGDDHADNPQVFPIAYAYVTSAAANPGEAGEVYEYAILNDYSMSPLAQTSIGAGINPSALVVDQGHLYVVNAGDGTISQYNIESDSTLTPMDPATVTNPGMQTFGVTGSAAAVDATGSFLYVANTADDSVSQFAIGSDGQLTALTPATVAAGAAPLAVVTSNPGVIYVVNSGAAGDIGSVSQYSEAAYGGLAPTNTAAVSAGTNPSFLAFNSTHSAAYVSSDCQGTQCLGSINQFTVSTGGALTNTGAIATTASNYRTTHIAIDQNGANAYVLSNQIGTDGEAGALWRFQVGSRGELTPDPASPLSIAGVARTQTLLNGSLYVLASNAGTGSSVIAYSLGAGGAPALEATTILSAPNPASMAVRVLLAP